MATIFSLDDVPSARSWINDLTAPEAVQQCRAFGIVPADTLMRNRVLLRAFMSNYWDSRVPAPPISCPTTFTVTVPTTHWSSQQTTAASASGTPGPNSLFGDASLLWDNFGSAINWPSNEEPLPPYSASMYAPHIPLTVAITTQADPVVITTPSLLCTTQPTPPRTLVTFAPSRPTAVLLSPRFSTTTPRLSIASVPSPKPSWLSHPLSNSAATRPSMASVPYSLAATLPSSRAQPSGQQPPCQGANVNYSQLIQDTAVAVGAQMAAALAQHQPPIRASATHMHPMQRDLISTVQVASGADTVALVRFLAEVKSISNLQLGDEDALLIALLGKTSGQLRTLWTQAVADRMPLSSVVSQLLEFFVPEQMRLTLASQLVYRSQRESESIPEYLDDVHTMSQLIMPHITEQQLVDSVINGLHPTVRARMAALPSPRSLQELQALGPRLELVRLMEPKIPTTLSGTNGSPAPLTNHRQPSAPYRYTSPAGSATRFQQPQRNGFRDYRPGQASNDGSGRYQQFGANVPPFPSDLRNQRPPSHYIRPDLNYSQRQPENSREGRRW